MISIFTIILAINLNFDYKENSETPFFEVTLYKQQIPFLSKISLEVPNVLHLLQVKAFPTTLLLLTPSSMSDYTLRYISLKEF